MPDIEHTLARAIYALTPWDAWLRPRRGARRVLRALSERGYVVVPTDDHRGAVVKALERIAAWPVGKAYPSHEIIEYAAEEVARLTTGGGQSDHA